MPSAEQEPDALPPGADRLGRALVVAQFALIAALCAWAAQGVLASPPRPAAALVLLGIAIGIWALAANRPGNFNIRPTPRPGGRLIRSGPYRWIRHPMYTSILLFCCGLWAYDGGRMRSGLGLLALLAVLLVKLRLEERWMSQVHPDYAAYRRRTWRLLPPIF